MFIKFLSDRVYGCYVKMMVLLLNSHCTADLNFYSRCIKVLDVCKYSCCSVHVFVLRQNTNLILLWLSSWLHVPYICAVNQASPKNLSLALCFRVNLWPREQHISTSTLIRTHGGWFQQGRSFSIIDLSVDQRQWPIKCKVKDCLIQSLQAKGTISLLASKGFMIWNQLTWLWCCKTWWIAHRSSASGFHD